MSQPLSFYPGAPTMSVNPYLAPPPPACFTGSGVPAVNYFVAQPYFAGGHGMSVNHFGAP